MSDVTFDLRYGSCKGLAKLLARELTILLAKASALEECASDLLADAQLVYQDQDEYFAMEDTAHEVWRLIDEADDYLRDWAEEYDNG